MWWLREIPEKENLAQYTYSYVDDIFTDEEIDNFVSLVYATEDIEKASTFNDSGNDVRSSNIAWLNWKQNDTYKYFYQKLTDAVIVNNNEFWRFNLSYIENLQFTEYSENYIGHYDYHCDTLLCPVPSNSLRKLSFAMLLNEKEDFEGGNFEIKISSEYLEMPQKKGRILFFPSPVLHKVHKVTKGTRLSLVGWVCGPSWT